MDVYGGWCVCVFVGVEIFWLIRDLNCLFGVIVVVVSVCWVDVVFEVWGCLIELIEEVCVVCVVGVVGIVGVVEVCCVLVFWCRGIRGSD